jgi:hypothetical protein
MIQKTAGLRTFTLDPGARGAGTRLAKGVSTD